MAPGPLLCEGGRLVGRFRTAYVGSSDGAILRVMAVTLPIDVGLKRHTQDGKGKPPQ